MTSPLIIDEIKNPGKNRDFLFQYSPNIRQTRRICEWRVCVLISGRCSRAAPLIFACVCGAGRLLAEIGVLFAEAVNTTSGVNKALFAGEEGVAVGADFHMHFGTLGGQGFDYVATGAADFGLVGFGMDFFSHVKYSWV
jgi:hypothetical protein